MDLKSIYLQKETKFIAYSPEETQKIAAGFSQILKIGDVIGLEGELGAGKTFFVQQVAEALNCKDFVTSPTFVIMNEYEAKIPFIHFDLYRIENELELENIGFSDFLNQSGVVFIEWYEIAKSFLPDNLITVKFKILDKKTREITISRNKK